MKQAVCNELFGSMAFSKTCELLVKHGFSGIEIAPYTISDDSGRISPPTLRNINATLKDYGLEFAGFHWLLAPPPVLRFTAADPALRNRARAHLKHLLHAAGELGGGNLIFGSPEQRKATDVSPADGLQFFIESLQDLAETASQAHNTICLEALPKSVTNIMNTLEEVERIVHTIDHPAIQGMFDFHNCDDETLSWERLLTKYRPIIRHVHLNNNNGGNPTIADAPAYRPAFQALKNSQYSGWISLEIFTTPEDPEQILRDTSELNHELLPP